MKKKRRKQRKVGSQGCQKSREDVTISDFANSSSPHSRLTKNTGLKVDSDEVQLKLEELHSESESDVKEAQNEGLNKKQKKEAEIEPWNGEITYPFDLWDSLSQFIEPSCVGKFACLCKDAYLSVNRASFWIKLYSRHAANVSHKAFLETGSEILPERLQSGYINRHCQGNLRVHVIRSLFFTYDPFRERLSSILKRSDPHSVVGKICVSAWTARKGSSYRFCLKVTSNLKPQKSILSINSTVSESDAVIDNWENLTEYPNTDIGISQEESCNILQLDSDVFSFLPGALSGLKIHEMNIISSGDGFRFQKVSMVLGPPHLRNVKDSKGSIKIHSPNSINLTVGNITAINLIDWYHPLYCNYQGIKSWKK